MRTIKLLFLATALAVSLAGISFGQERTGDLEGTVKDPTGALVPGVAVTIKSATSTTEATTTTGIATGFNRTVTTDDQGFFRLLQVPPGYYVVSTAPMSGFGESRTDNVQVALGRTTPVNIQLAAGQATATVNVAAAESVDRYNRKRGFHQSFRPEAGTTAQGTDFYHCLESITRNPARHSGGWMVC